MMYNVDVQKVKTLLKFDGIDFEFTDEELEILIESKIDELEGIIGTNIKPYDKTKIRGKFKGKILELDDYPVLQIAHIFVNDRCVPPHKYNVNYDLGIIYFSKRIYGNVRVQYTVGLSEENFQYLIVPLIKDMVGYTITYGKANKSFGGFGGFASSLKEGDVSVNFSSFGGSGVGEYGYTAGINTKIDDLKNRFGYRARVRWI